MSSGPEGAAYGSEAGPGGTLGARLLARPLGELLSRAPVTADPSIPVAAAAATMSDADVSCLLLVTDGALVGILTDRDLRRRVLGAGADPAQPVAGVMTREPLTLDEHASALDAVLLMTQHGIHHVPVTRAGRLHGVVTSTDLLRLRLELPVFIAEQVRSSTDVDAIAEVAARIPHAVHNLAIAGAGGLECARLVTALVDALTRQLIALQLEALGEPPVAFAWLALGSQARREQGVRSDQDNALVLAAPVQRPDDVAFFHQLATGVCDGLARCGFRHCPGDVMATNPRWRQDVEQWTRTLERWISRPEPVALLEASIFFDMRGVYGDDRLVGPLTDTIAARASDDRIFLAALARLTHRLPPALTWWGGLRRSRRDGGRGRVDLKRGAVLPLVELARLHALTAGDDETGTVERLRSASAAGHMNASDATSLVEAFELVLDIRLQHQARQTAAGEAADNFLDPRALSAFRRGQLRSALRRVRSAQGALALAYPA